MATKSAETVRRNPLPRLPSSEEIESIIIGTVLLWPDTAPQVLSALSKSDFNETRNRFIFAGICGVAESGGSPDVVTVSERLHSDGTLDKAGGRLQLNALAELPTSREKLSQYIKIVLDKSARRGLLAASDRIRELGMDESRDLRDVASDSVKVLEETRLLQSVGDVSAPVVEANESTVRVDWVHLQVRAVVTGLKEHKDGDVDGFLKISTTVPGHPRDLHSAKFNFVSSRTQTEWANILTKRADFTDWQEIIAALCRIVTDHVHRVVPLEVIGEDDAVKPVEFALWPILMYKGPTVLFGEPGTLKSYVATLYANLVSTGRNLLDFRVDKKLSQPLYLDWEAERDRTDERVMMLRNGLGLPKSPFWYLHCDRTLADDIEKIKDRMDEVGSEFVIIDSLALAAGGELTTAQPAIDFFRALRRLNCSSLIVAHTSKEQSAQKTIYGSVYFNALARSVWEMRKYQEEGSNCVSVGFIHKKGNYGQLEHPFGLQFTFETDRRCVIVTRDDVRKNPSAEAARPLPYRIIKILEERGKMKSIDIAAELDVSSDAARVALNRLQDKKQVLRIGNGIWAAQAGMDSDGEAPF